MSVSALQPDELMRALAASLPLHFDELSLRLFTSDDFEAVVSYRNRPENRRFMYAPNQTPAELRAWVAGGAPVFLRDGDAVNLAIEAEGVVVGDVMLKVVSLPSRQMEIGWSLHPDHTGRGIASRAAEALLDLAFELGAHRVVAVLDEDNRGSARVAERIGMQLEATLVDAEVNPATGDFGTTLIYAQRQGAP